MKKTIVFLAVLALLVVMFFKFFIFGEKNHLANDIKQLKNAVEREHAQKVFYYFDPAYHDKNNIAYQDLRQIMDDLFAQGDSIKITMSGLKIWIDSTSKEKTIFARCSLGLKVFARYDGELVMVFGGAIIPSPVVGYFKKSDKHYKIYSADY